MPPLVSRQTRLLILGSFPSAASLAVQQYYGHPQNHFWKILKAIFGDSPYGTCADSYQIRSEWLLSRQLGLWDVYAACEREGSLDSRIRHPQVNDFASLALRCPQLEAIAHNGVESFKHSRQVVAALGTTSSAANAVASVEAGSPTAGPPQGRTAPSGGSAVREATSVGVYIYKLPSTSPANASWSFERKLAAWREVFEQHGLI
ncbi:DNA-deoxyinosine glycosylase [Polaromonas sp.]|uniref:DNA-deoxyinosine glycosylase n=1 Tax=Polaromonas sp. TaxID=1869339 RepID=UPI002FC71A9A